MKTAARLAATLALALAGVLVLAAVASAQATPARAVPARQVFIKAKLIALQPGSEQDLSTAWTEADSLPGASAPTLRFARGQFDAALAPLVQAGRAKLLSQWQTDSSDGILTALNLSFALPASKVVATPAYDCENRNLKVVPVLVNYPHALIVTPHLQAGGSVSLAFNSPVMVVILPTPQEGSWRDGMHIPVSALPGDTPTALDMSAKPDHSQDLIFTLFNDLPTEVTVASGETLAIAGCGPSQPNSVDVVTLLTVEVR